MSKRYNEKRAKAAEFAINKELDSGYGRVNEEANAAADIREAAMGKGEEELYERKMTKEEKKAAAKAAREAKKKAKEAKKGGKAKKGDGEANEEKKDDVDALEVAKLALDSGAQKSEKQDQLDAWLSEQNIGVTYEARKGKQDPNARDINVSGVTVTFHGKPLIEDTEIVINYGNRYGFIGPNGSGKSTIMKAIAARSIPIPENLEMYFLDQEYPASDICALDAVMESNDEVARLEKRAEILNDAMADADEDQQAEIQTTLEAIYDRLDQLDASAAEARATSILHGLGFTTAMQKMPTKSFSGGWRMRVALARALFLPTVECLVMDEPTVRSSLFHRYVDAMALSASYGVISYRTRYGIVHTTIRITYASYPFHFNSFHLFSSSFSPEPS